MDQYTAKYVGFDVHKEMISVATAHEGRSEPIYYGEISNEAEALRKLVKKVASNGESVSFCYEAGPCGYDVYRRLIDLGQRCEVVAPSLIPKKPGAGEDKSAGCDDSCSFTSSRGVDVGVGPGRGTGSDKRSDACP